MEEIMYASEQYKNKYKRRKPLTPQEKKERNAKKHEKLFDRLEKLNNKSGKNKCENKIIIDDNTKVEDNKVGIDELKNLVSQIQNRK